MAETDMDGRIPNLHTILTHWLNESEKSESDVTYDHVW